MYMFIALFDNMYENAINDDPVSLEIKIDTYGDDEIISESTVWKWAIDKAFDYQKKHDNLSFATLKLIYIS